MSDENKIHRINFLSLLLVAMLANILAQATHETGHLAVYQLMGHDPVWKFTGLVQMWGTPPIHPDEWVETSFEGERGWLKLSSPQESKVEKVIAIAVGPLAGLAGAALGLVIARRSKKIAIRQVGLAWTLSASLVAMQYYLRSPMRTGGDEYEIATQLGIPASPINISLGLAFALCLGLALRELPGWRMRLKWLGTVFLGSVATGILMVVADGLVTSQVDAGHPRFRPVLGYSFPVFLVYGLALVGIWLWARRHAEMKD